VHDRHAGERESGQGAAVRALGAELVLRGAVFDECRDIAAQLAASTGAYYVDSGDEPKLIAGVATAALELFELAPRLDALFVPVGAGTVRPGPACPHRRSRRGAG